MSIQDVVLVDLPQSEWLSAISKGDVAAIVGWPPYTLQIKERFPSESVAWQVQSDQALYGILVARNDWIAEHPTVIARFWKSLSQAEGFLVAHPEQAKAIVRTRLEHNHAYFESVWGQYNFSLSLDQSLIVAMEDEARWIINNNLTAEKQVPDFLEYIYEDGLREIRPEAVNIFR
jgi:NitT/TauT family transport system substrate-binding protein